MTFFSKRVRVLLVSILLTLFSISARGQLNTLGEVQKTLSRVDNIVSQTSQLVQKIDNAVNIVTENQYYKALIDGKEFKFPIGILPASGDKKYALIINSISMTPDGLFAEIFMKVPVSSDKSLYFLADHVPFSRTGGIAGDLRLYLLKTDSITFGKDRGYSVLFDGLEEGGEDKSCFVTFNCKGFKDATLTGSVNFSRNSIVKDSKSQEVVSLSYYTQADKLSNFIIQFKEVPTFEFANLPGFKCTVNELTLDRSEVMNAPDFDLPGWYSDSIRTLLNDQAVVVDGPDWEGVYIPSISIEIPKAFHEDKTSEVISINSKDLIIDQNGVTGLNSADNLLDGKIKGWSYSIQHLEVNIIANALSSGSITGEISLPICKDDSKVGFGLTLTKSLASKDISYKGYVEAKNDGGLLNAEAFGLAKVQIKSSKFEFEYSNEQFYPGAVIDGSLSLTPKKDTANADSKSIASFGLEFEKLALTSRAPYLEIETGGYVQMSGDGSMMANFPVSISDVGLTKENGGQRIGILLDLDVKLQKSGGDSKGSNGFGGSTSFTIWTKRDIASQKWKFDGVHINGIEVDVDNSSFKLHGELYTFNNDTVYGTGFCGSLRMVVVNKIEVDASAIFGRRKQIEIDPNNPPTDASISDSQSDYRYWFVDAAAYFPPITVAPFVAVNGFIGGLYHNMKLDTKPASLDTKVDCKTASGFTYVPDSSIYLGLMAGVGLQSVPSASVFNGKITLGLEFNNSGGLNMVALWGGVILLTPEFEPPKEEDIKKDMKPKDKIDEVAIKQEEPDPNSGALRVTWFTEYDVPNKTFIGDFDIYINFEDIIAGSLDKTSHKAGHIAVMFSPDANYVYVGTPMQPIGVSIAKIFELNSYFCAGNTLPVPPIAPLPPEFKFTAVDYNALSSGAGLSFGSRFHTGAKPGINFKALGCKLWVGAEVWVDAGFDVLISKSNQPINCSGYNPRGINNWYATGQAFIAGGMRVGIDYDCAIGSGTKNLLSASLSAYVFAQLPRPTYLVGSVHVDFEILKLSFHKDLDFKVGDQCDLNDLNKDIVFIDGILPADKSTDVKVTEKIVVNFANPIEKFEFTLPDEGSSSGGTKQYRAMVSNSDVSVIANGNVIACRYEWNGSKTQLTLTPNRILPENTSIKVDVKVVLEVDNGGWSPSGKIETLSSIFTTQYEPATIEVANVDYAYPLPEMANYYRMESNAGYIKLGVLPDKPMKLANNYAYNVLFYNGNGEVARVTDVTVNDNVGVEQFTYTIPNDKLSDKSSYTLKLVKTPLNAQTKEVKQDNVTLGYIADTKDSVILTYSFTTSQFSSFAQKIAYYNQSSVEISGTSVAESIFPSKTSDTKHEDFAREETYGYEPRGGYKTTNQMVRTMGADFTSGVAINGPVPADSVDYSSFGEKLVIQYNVISEIDKINQENKTQKIVCALDQSNAQVVNCNSASGPSGTFTFAKGTKLSYKFGYFLPGRDTKTSEVTLSFELPQPIDLNY